MKAVINSHFGYYIALSWMFCERNLNNWINDFYVRSHLLSNWVKGIIEIAYNCVQGEWFDDNDDELLLWYGWPTKGV